MTAKQRDLRLQHLCVGIVSLAMLTLIETVGQADEPETLFPADSGMVDVTKPPYNAKGDGRADDTDAIVQAIQAGDFGASKPRVLFFPSGTYLVSRTLDWKTRSGKWNCALVFWGQGQSRTCIRLKDECPGFGDAANPKAVIFTASELEPGAHWHDRWTARGEGNGAFRNSIRGLTIDVGRGNPGAVGIDYLANNVGFVRDVTVRSSDSGVCGIQMHREEPGPAFLKDVRVLGFDVGISLRGNGYGITVENLTLKGQRTAGLRNDANAFFIRNLVSENAVPAVQNRHLAYMMLQTASLTNGAAGNWAIDNDRGVLFVRDAECQGYAGLIRNQSGHNRGVEGKSVAEFVSHDPQALFGAPSRSLRLPIEETPDYHTNDFSQWANVGAFGAKSNDYTDDAEAIQAAIDSGKEMVYQPTGRYVIGKPIIIRGAVKKIYGMESYIMPPDRNAAFTGPDGPRPVFTVAEGKSDLVVLEGLWAGGAPAFKETTFVEHARRDLAIRDCALAGKWSLRSTSGAGKLYLEDVTMRCWFAKGQHVWARQLDSETQQFTDQPLIRNDGADLWVLGMKTEGPCTIIETLSGGRTELLGGIFDPVRPVPADRPAFINDQSSVTLSYDLFTYGGASRYEVHVLDTQGGQTRRLMRADIPKRGDSFGSYVPLYRSFAPEPARTQPSSRPTGSRGAP